MAKYKLYRLIKILRKPELSDFEKFLRSPIHNSNKNCLLLFKELRKKQERLTDSPPEKEKLFKSVFGKVAYHDGKMRKLMTQLSQLLEQYLAMKEMLDNDTHRQEMLMYSLAKRNDHKLFELIADQRLSTLENASKGLNYFRGMANLYRTKYWHPETRHFTMSSNLFGQYLHFHECLFILETLQNDTEYRILKRIVPHEKRAHLVRAVTEVAAHGDFAQSPVIKLFSHLHRLYLPEVKKPELDEIEKLLFNQFNSLEDFEQRMALKLLINYATPFSNNGSPGHTRFLFGLYRFGVEKGMMLNGVKAINSLFFTNIVVAGCMAGELDWIKNFITDYGPLLPNSERNTAIHLASAFHYYHLGKKSNILTNFYTALGELNQIPLRSAAKFELRMRSLQLRIGLEMLHRQRFPLDDLLNQVRNFERHLETSTSYSEDKKDNYRSFLKYFRQLARLTNSPERNKILIDNYVKELLSSHLFVLRFWLLEKAEGLR